MSRFAKRQKLQAGNAPHQTSMSYLGPRFPMFPCTIIATIATNGLGFSDSKSNYFLIKPSMKKSTAASKSPFTAKLFAFLGELKENNNREWFAENKPRYESDVLLPAMEFVTQMQSKLEKHSRYLLASPKRVGGSIMRVYRDTRFSKDKIPYKTNVGIHFRHSIGSDVHAPGLYLHLEPKACFAAAGIWMPPTEPLTAIRQSIMDTTADWNKVLKNKKFAARFKLDGDSLKTAPRGTDPNHPAIVDLRRKNFAGITPLSEHDILRSDLIDFISDIFQDAKPLMKFLCDSLQLPY
jgi:uncharacterized protein (TIGR02453 family)